MMPRWTHAVCDPCWTEMEPGGLPVRMAKPRIEYCGWCAARTESGVYRRADPETVPYPDQPADARCFIAGFRRSSLPPGAAYIDTDQGRRIYFGRMADGDAVFIAGQFREWRRIALRRRSPPPRLLGLS